MGWDWAWRWAGESREDPENLVRKKMAKESRERPSLNGFGGKGAWKTGSNGKKWDGLAKIPNPQKFQGSNCVYSIGIEPKRRSDLLRVEPRELQANHGKEIRIKEDNDTKENLWSGNDAEPGIFCGF